MTKRFVMPKDKIHVKYITVILIFFTFLKHSHKNITLRKFHSVSQYILCIYMCLGLYWDVRNIRVIKSHNSYNDRVYNLVERQASKQV